MFSTCYLPKVALFQGSIVSLMEARRHRDSNYGHRRSALIILRVKWVICGCCVEGLTGGKGKGGGRRGGEGRWGSRFLVSSPRRPSPNYSPHEQRAETWAQRENINGVCDIMVAAHSKEIYYIRIHQQVISHFVEVDSCFMKHRLVRLIKHRYYSGPAFIDQWLVCPRAGSGDNLTST